MALEGTLRDFSLADIFQLIGLQRKTGVLTLRGKDDSVTVTFLDGRVVAADSLNKRLENRLGTVLVKTGLLTPEQLSRALEIQKETLQRLGYILVHNHIISQDNLRQALQLQILGVVYRLFRWHDGEYHFSQETTIEYDRDNVIPITAESILMEGARMIDEWPIIEKRVRSYDMVFRKKAINQEIVVVDPDQADEVDFDEPQAGTAAKRKKTALEKIKISPQEKMIYDMVDGSLKVADIVESSRLSEFDTVKALYELLTRDLIEERKAAGAPVVEQAAVDETAPTEIPTVVPLPLIIVLVILAVASIISLARNPMNRLSPVGRKTSPMTETLKAISLQRIDSIGDSLEAHYLATGRLPSKLEELSPTYLPEHLLKDPWGNRYKYIQRPERYLVIGFRRDGKPDTDLFLSRSTDIAAASSQTRPPEGGIVLID
jgi:hypothetical protein